MSQKVITKKELLDALKELKAQASQMDERIANLIANVKGAKIV